MKKILLGLVATLVATACLPAVAGTGTGRGANGSNYSGTKNTTEAGHRDYFSTFIPGVSRFTTEITGRAASLQQNLATARAAASQAVPAPEAPLETIVVQPEPPYVAPLAPERKPLRKKPVRGRG
jgi:hypothetical protein